MVDFFYLKVELKSLSIRGLICTNINAKRSGRNILDITLDISLKLDKMISFNDQSARNLIKISRFLGI